MMAPERRNQIALGVLIVALAVIVFWQMSPPATTVPGAPPSNTRTARNGGQKSAAEVPDVKLEVLQQERPAPGDAHRNLFRFGVPPPPPPPPPSVQRPPLMPPPAPGPGTTGGPPTTAGVPPIPLRFMGFVQEEGKGKVAALEDDRGVYHGREGDIIEGRYRIRQIGVESIVLEHIDGRGSQTIARSNRGQ